MRHKIHFTFLDRRQPGPRKSVLLDRRQPEHIKSVLLVRIGCREVEKWQTWICEKKVLIWRHLRKGLQISLKIGHFDIFLKNGPNDFFGFWPKVSTKYDFQFEWNLLFRKISYLEIFDLEIIKKLPKLRFLVIFSTLYH